MKYVAAYLLSQMAGNEEPTVADVKEIIMAGEAEFDEKLATIVVDKLRGKDIKQLIMDGKSKLSSVMPTSEAVPSTQVAQPSAVQEKQPEPVQKEESEEEEEMGLGGMFD